MLQRWRDVLASLRTWPSGPEWQRVALELLWALPLILLTAWCGGLVSPTSPPASGELARLAAALLIAPALGEELLFRATLIPREPPRSGWMLLSVALFVAWHPLQALTVGPAWSSAFLDPWFLACVAILGLALARIYAATRSLWPCVLVHWAVVLTWKALLGGPF